ncbi:hypothetical protein LL947_12055 [Halomonas sp. BLK-85]
MTFPPEPGEDMAQSEADMSIYAAVRESENALYHVKGRYRLALGTGLAR